MTAPIRAKPPETSGSGQSDAFKKGRTEMKPTSVTPEDLLPHRGRMKLIDEIIEMDEKRAATSSTVTDRWPFFLWNCRPCVGLHRTGGPDGWHQQLLERHQKARGSFYQQGWLVGIKDAVFHIDSLPLNAHLATRTENCFEFEGYIEILGTVEIASQVIAGSPAATDAVE
jgi:predicted hotdog family 3-hydroxylacyl-ACP dehydratase